MPWVAAGGYGGILLQLPLLYPPASNPGAYTPEDPHSDFIQIDISATGGCRKKSSRKDDPSVSSPVDVVQGISRIQRGQVFAI